MHVPVILEGRLAAGVAGKPAGFHLPAQGAVALRILITGAAGNLGGFLARRLSDRGYELNLMIHRRPLPPDLADNPRVRVYRADLADPGTLALPCRESDALIHFAGVLFAPRPERFLPITNIEYVENLIRAALEGGVERFIIVSFPHVEGATTPLTPATGRPDGCPSSVHARTRLAAERHLFEACRGQPMVPVTLRAGLIYGRGVLMPETARTLLRYGLLPVWPGPTWTHPISLDDFLDCAEAALVRPGISGVYNLGDDEPITLQHFLDLMADHWGFRRPVRLPAWIFYAAAAAVEAYATVFHTASPLTRDFIRIGMASYVSDTTRMKSELVSELRHQSFAQGVRTM